MLMRPKSEATLAYMREQIREFNRLIEAADLLSQKPRIAYETPISRSTLKKRDECATSMNDILDAKSDRAYLLSDPVWGPRIKAWSDMLNSTKKGR